MRGVVFACALCALCGCGKSSAPSSGAPAPAASIDAAPEPGPEPEVAPPAVKVDLPQVPDFAFHADDGFTSIAELRTRPHAHEDTDVKVKGYVTWVYDCVDDAMEPGQDRAAVQKAIDEDPTTCERPQLRLGATPDGSEATDLWVVEVPRAPNAAEKQHLSKADLAAWPAVPVFAKGDQVVVTGTWASRSPHGFASAGGLLVYASLEKVTP